MDFGQSIENVKEHTFPNQNHSNKDAFRRPRLKRCHVDASKINPVDKRRKRVRRGNDKDVQSLADAIKTCVPSLIEDVVFSELEDKAIESGCLTEDECRTISRIDDRKKQVRKVVLLITKRSFKTMNNFLEAVHTAYPYIAENIWKEFHWNFKERPKYLRSKRMCPLCSLKSAVDVEKVIDNLYSAKVIDDNLYATINSSRNEVGQQDKHWDAVLKACLRKQGIGYLLASLETNDHYTHITNHVRNLFKNNTDMKQFCTCSKYVLDKSLAKIRTLSLDSSASHTPPETSDSNCGSDDDMKSESETEKGTQASSSGILHETCTTVHDSDKMQIELSESDITYHPLINSNIECSAIGNKVRVETREQPLLTVFTDMSNRPKANELFPVTTENLHPRQRNKLEQAYPVLKHDRIRNNEKFQQIKGPGRFKSAVTSALVRLRVLKQFKTKRSKTDSSENFQVDVSEMIGESEL